MTITVNIMSYNHINFFHCFADVGEQPQHCQRVRSFAKLQREVELHTHDAHSTPVCYL